MNQNQPIGPSTIPQAGEKHAWRCVGALLPLGPARPRQVGETQMHGSPTVGHVLLLEGKLSHSIREMFFLEIYMTTLSLSKINESIWKWRSLTGSPVKEAAGLLPHRRTGPRHTGPVLRRGWGSADTILKFLAIFQQDVPHYHFILASAN